MRETGETIIDPGCHLDNHRGHYITRDMLWLAESFGYIIDPVMQYALANYERDSDADNYPIDCLHDEADKALEWLNGGPNEGLDRPIKGQNSPPLIPDGYAWDWYEGDFGLYPLDPCEACGEPRGENGDDDFCADCLALMKAKREETNNG